MTIDVLYLIIIFAIVSFGYVTIWLLKGGFNYDCF